MNTMLPIDDQFIEQVAKAVGKDRLFREASALLENTIGVNISQAGISEDRFTHEFEKLWAGTDEECKWNREEYRADARAAINKINFLLLTMLN